VGEVVVVVVVVLVLVVGGAGAVSDPQPAVITTRAAMAHRNIAARAMGAP